MTYSWLLFYGLHEFHLTLDEFNIMTLGETVDLINCLSVYKGAAREKQQLTFDQIMALR